MSYDFFYTKVDSHDLCFPDTHQKHFSILLPLQLSLLLLILFPPVVDTPQDDRSFEVSRGKTIFLILIEEL